jgi:hypothetical protein
MYLKNLLRPKIPILKQIKGCVMAFSFYQLHPKATLCLRLRRAYDDAALDVGFKNGYIDLDTVHNWLGGVSTACISIWYNQAQVTGATNAVQANPDQQPVWGYWEGADTWKRGISFGSPFNLTVASYTGMNILSDPLALYTQFYKPDQVDNKYLFCRNNEDTASRQYGIYLDSTAPFNNANLFMNGSSRCSTDTVAPTSRVFFRWYNGVIYQDSGVADRSTAYASQALAEAPSTYIGCRGNAGATQYGHFDGEIKTIMLFNSIVSKAAVELMKLYDF